ncbi:MAG: 3-deoxy-D-manno-octulosonate cytidylyltransferase [Bacteroidetes bacterium GWF2_42_66]|nr:MAG: 3-deoxy-D-manno-octulosonate cytidylyltransferase [Bacteroidetes bacterium GWA2_42_15]OFX96322.1 MAG: 3-deoxy-D-manno-octulosonate cytidylyltransferase [Bacteroidetes bacterium GWE2_42_39]OFY46361.1 MAG: 3-deoxy-D-manno-octulosonate cytidylyltransferase [Bacteroidetes bacterium GWF2_42_66]HAZ03484.1 3-deoxy-manno-octulosonate cytidylyltransferase [Marinilabiliales bacterium]HBL78252.1 3-deoxy-manno-octulosonate cytidylyltransferase [Prolixibacteraceae bacterium]
MNIIGIIPARLASSRFPNKPMADILGMPMIGHCYKRSKMSSLLNEVYVATCDMEIYNYIESIGGKAIITADTHERASDRTAEALLKIEKSTGKKVDIVVMIQGDEPMITPEMIQAAVHPLIDSKEIKISNLYTNIKTVKEFEDPNEVKVVINKNEFAIYFSREPIPSRKKGVLEVPMYKQVCIIPFKRDFLLEYNNMKQTPLEKIESVDMMRIIENGLQVKMIYTDDESYSVDTLEDLEVVVKKITNDTLLKKYL